MAKRSTSRRAAQKPQGDTTQPTTDDKPVELTRESVSTMSEADCIEILKAHGVEDTEFLSLEDLRASVTRVVFVDDTKLADDQGDQGDQGDDEPTVPVKLKFDAWTADGRCKKGETVPMPVSDAAKLIDKGKAERADPLPGGSA